ncbi:MAG: hypothetical protein ACKV2V_11750 [Blastocatellia bacterium]
MSKNSKGKQNQPFDYMKKAQEILRMENGGGLPPAELAAAPQNGQLAADALLKIIDPWKKDVDTSADLQYLLDLAVIAWGLSFRQGKTPADKARPWLRELTLPLEDKLVLRNLICEMLTRKLIYFRNVNWIIERAIVQDTEDGYHIGVFGDFSDGARAATTDSPVMPPSDQVAHEALVTETSIT